MGVPPTGRALWKQPRSLAWLHRRQPPHPSGSATDPPRPIHQEISGYAVTPLHCSGYPPTLRANSKQARTARRQFVERWFESRLRLVVPTGYGQPHSDANHRQATRSAKIVQPLW
jgi:hypothetical protein